MCIRPKPSRHKMLTFKFLKLFKLFKLLDNIAGLALTALLLFGQTSGSEVFTFDSDFNDYPINLVKPLNLEKPLYPYWQYETAGEYRVASDNVRELYLVNSRNILMEINLTNGLQNWEMPIGGQMSAEFFVYKDSLIQIIQIKKESTSKSNESNADTAIGGYIIRSTDKLTGITKWQITIPPIDLQGKIYCRLFEDKFIIVTTAGNLISLNNSDGSIIQKKIINSDFTIQPFFDVSKFYIAALNNKVSAISYSDFTENSEVKMFFSPTTFLVSENLLVWGDRRGLVSASNFLTPGKNIKWRSRKGGEILSLTGTAAGILAASTDNYIYLMSGKSGDTIWKKRLASRAAFEPKVAGDYVVVSTLGETEALIFDLKTGRTVNRIALSNGNFYTDAPILLEKVIIFRTSRGLIAYSNINYSQAE